MAEEFERIFVIPLKKTGFKSSKAAPVAVKRVKQYLTRHMKVEDENIWIDESLNNALWSHGKYSMPSKIRVKAVKFEDGVVEVSLPELELKKSRRELLKEEREKKEPILRRREEEEGEGVGGAEDYEIAPTAEGDVKIKKRKPARKKETTEKEKPEKTKKPKTKKTHAKKKTSKKEEIKPKTAKKTTKKKASTKKEKK